MNFIKDEDGLEVVEYAVIGGLILLVTITIIGTLGTQVTNAFTSLSQNLTDGGIAATP